ncbi:MAG: hypothetical protein ABFR36_01650 [Acidobacteriota bacterium]
MDKKKINTIIFFTILYWLITYIFIIKKGFIFDRIGLPQILIFIGLNLVIIFSAKLLIPVFDLILKITGKLGSLIFGIITSIIFFFILTPISLVRRVSGKEILKLGFNDKSETYYEEWEHSPDFSKQY